MTVDAAQIKAAEAKGLINVVPLARACEVHKFPFYLGCVILDKETRGLNIFGHDKGGAFSDPSGKNIEVTEARYREFRRLIDSGKTSNGVGPMQITWKGYFTVMESEGLRPWVPADNIRFGISILSATLNHGLSRGLPVGKAFWDAAKAYNGNASYADDATARAKVWLAVVGDTDTRDDTMPLSDADLARIQTIIQSTVTSPAVVAAIARAVWETDGIIQAGADETDPNNTKWRAETFLQKTYNNTIPK